MKTKTTHTPGPWRCEIRTADDPAALPNYYAGETGVIKEYFVLDSHGNDVVKTYERADARLIAAAPDMLSALKDARYILSQFKIADGATIEAAIAKAEGR